MFAFVIRLASALLPSFVASHIALVNKRVQEHPVTIHLAHIVCQTDEPPSLLTIPGLVNLGVITCLSHCPDILARQVVGYCSTVIQLHTSQHEHPSMDIVYPPSISPTVELPLPVAGDETLFPEESHHALQAELWDRRISSTLLEVHLPTISSVVKILPDDVYSFRHSSVGLELVRYTPLLVSPCPSTPFCFSSWLSRNRETIMAYLSPPPKVSAPRQRSDVSEESMRVIARVVRDSLLPQDDEVARVIARIERDYAQEQERCSESQPVGDSQSRSFTPGSSSFSNRTKNPIPIREPPAEYGTGLNTKARVFLPKASRPPPTSTADRGTGLNTRAPVFVPKANRPPPLQVAQIHPAPVDGFLPSAPSVSSSYLLPTPPISPWTQVPPPQYPADGYWFLPSTPPDTPTYSSSPLWIPSYGYVPQQEYFTDRNVIS